MGKGKRYNGVRRYLLKEDGYPMRSGDILVCFGLRSGHPIPPELGVCQVIAGVRVQIDPKTKRGMEKRVFAYCPECGKKIEAGHLSQHVEAFHPSSWEGRAK